MLKDAVTGRDIESLGYVPEFMHLKGLMSNEEFDALCDHIRGQLDAVKVGGVVSAGWLAPKEWANTVYMPIYEKSCGKDEKAAGMFYGSIFKLVVIEHKSLWRCVKQPKKENDPEGIEITLYWRATE